MNEIVDKDRGTIDEFLRYEKLDRGEENSNFFVR